MERGCGKGERNGTRIKEEKERGRIVAVGRGVARTFYASCCVGKKKKENRREEKKKGGKKANGRASSDVHS